MEKRRKKTIDELNALIFSQEIFFVLSRQKIFQETDFYIQ